MKKLMTFALAVSLGACNSGGTVSGPTPVPETVSAVSEPVAAATPKPEAPAPGSSFDVVFKDRAGFKVSYSGSGARVVAFITSFDDQDTPLASKQRDLIANQSWEDTFDTTCVQLDIDQPGVKLIAAAFYDKEGKRFKTSDADAGDKVKACRCEPTWSRSEKYETIYGAWVVNGCSKSRTVTRRYTETQTCTNANRTVDIVGEPEVANNPLPASFSNTSFAEQDRDSGWRTDWWVVASASVQNAAEWKLEIYSASRTSEYDDNDPDYVKKTVVKTLKCGESADLFAEYHSEGHESDVWWAALYRNGTRVWKSQAEFN